MSVSINSTTDFITFSSYPQAIAHIDCDAFFASCEQARDPYLKGKPLVTGQERGIISAASYEAKALGIKRGITLSEAKKIYPGLIIIPSDYELYSIYSERLFNIIRRFTPQVEEYSIDEAFCDLSGLRRMYRSSYPDISVRIKEAIRKELDITVSVGLSLSKTLAKICSRENKPDGFKALPGNELHDYLKNIPLERVCGFGPNTVALLGKYGINSVLDYIRRPKEFAQKILGKIGLELWLELRGVSVYPVSTDKKEKYLSISKTKTFMPASGNKQLVMAQLMRNLESAFIKLRRHSLSARNLTVYLKKVDFSAEGMQGRINRHSSSTLDFTSICSRIFDEVFQPGAVYRATGVILSDIKEGGFDEHDLFEDPVKIEQLQRVSAAVDEINQAFGKHTIHIAASNIIAKKASHPRNNLAWRKIELLKGETFRRRLNIPLLKLF
ncbi:MAG: DNA polymerase IV [Candidatus Omnitrophota bacterium]|nr:DNA polymerase IV [Candidatus Omnitrophota bacterium]MBU1929044.1 DNA polymerase IV [Candidatus Omnitrophota bacterium]MBU2034385.1 DNA polymerase IV [Candidatus Omnitrophota bacterium]MBU2221476.1 DNA polymerase IV [Candidatus Omnitrophota bacterium]